MAKGAIGKQLVTAKIAEAFGADYIGEVDKKLYVWTQENGERIQIAIALTCPKNLVGATEAAQPTGLGANAAGGGDWNFEDMPVRAASEPAVITQDEQKNIEDLMTRLGL